MIISPQEKLSFKRECVGRKLKFHSPLIDAVVLEMILTKVVLYMISFLEVLEQTD